VLKAGAMMVHWIGLLLALETSSNLPEEINGIKNADGW
jgi:hypothetical protein